MEALLLRQDKRDLKEGGKLKNTVMARLYELFRKGKSRNKYS